MEVIENPGILVSEGRRRVVPCRKWKSASFGYSKMLCFYDGVLNVSPTSAGPISQQSLFLSYSCLVNLKVITAAPVISLCVADASVATA